MIRAALVALFLGCAVHGTELPDAEQGSANEHDTPAADAGAELATRDAMPAADAGDVRGELEQRDAGAGDLAVPFFECHPPAMIPDCYEPPTWCNPAGKPSTESCSACRGGHLFCWCAPWPGELPPGYQPDAGWGHEACEWRAE